MKHKYLNINIDMEYGSVIKLEIYSIETNYFVVVVIISGSQKSNCHITRPAKINL